MMKPETNVKSLSEESDWDKKKEDIPEEVILAENFTLKELSGKKKISKKTLKSYFITLKSQRVQCWKLMQMYKRVWQYMKA